MSDNDSTGPKSCHCQPGEPWHKRGAVGWCWYPPNSGAEGTSEVAR